MAGEFTDSFFHTGGDEVTTSCWTSIPRVVTWMKSKNLTAMGVLGYVQQRIQAIVVKHGKRTMVWDEFWAADLPALNSTVAEIRSKTFAQTLSAGRPALTTGINEAWYFDHGISKPRFVQDDCEPYYNHDPFDGLSAEQLKLSSAAKWICGARVWTSQTLSRVCSRGRPRWASGYGRR